MTAKEVAEQDPFVKSITPAQWAEVTTFYGELLDAVHADPALRKYDALIATVPKTHESVVGLMKIAGVQGLRGAFARRDLEETELARRAAEESAAARRRELEEASAARVRELEARASQAEAIIARAEALKKQLATLTLG